MQVRRAAMANDKSPPGLPDEPTFERRIPFESERSKHDIPVRNELKRTAIEINPFRDAAIPRVKRELEEAFSRLEPEDHVGLGLASFRSGAFVWAIAFFQKAVDADPSNLGARYGCGLSLIGSGQSNEAIAVFESLTREEQGDAFAHYWLARAYSLSNQLAEAVDAYKRAFSLDKELAGLHADYMKRGQLTRSRFQPLAGRNLRNTNLNWPGHFPWPAVLNLGEPPNTTKGFLFSKNIPAVAKDDISPYIGVWIEGRAGGGKQTPTAKEVGRTNAPGRDKPVKLDSAATGVAEAVRDAIAAGPSELLEKNIAIAIDATREGLSLAEAFAKAADVALHEPHAQGKIADQWDHAIEYEDQRHDQLLEMNEDDLRRLAELTKANPWSSKLGEPPSEFISDVYKEWLGKKRLMRGHLVKIAPKLMTAYATEIGRHPERRLKYLGERVYTRHGSLPKRLPKAPSNRWVPTADLDEEQLHARRLVEAKKKRDQRAQKAPKKRKRVTKRGRTPSP